MGRVYWIAAICLLASCGYLFNTQKITINTANGKPAHCILKNDRGKWQAVTAQPVEISKSQSVLKISCSGKELQAYKLVKADASHIYPSTITVYLKKKKMLYGDSTPRDNEDDASPSEIDADHPEDASRPLNILPDVPQDSDNPR